MKKLIRQTLKSLSDHRTGPYRVFSHYKTTVGAEIATKQEALEKVYAAFGYEACFSSYLRNSFINKKGTDGNSTREYLPLFIKYDKTFDAALVDQAIGTNLAHIDAYSKYFDITLAELNSYVKIEYDAKDGYISILPNGSATMVYMLAYLTKLRTLFELPYTITSCFAEIFQEDFPELDSEEIAYLLAVFILKSPTGHGFFNYFSMGRASKYMTFADIMQEAQKTKYSGMNSGGTRIIESETLKGVSYDIQRYPEEVVDRYKLLLENKEIIIDTFIKKIKHEESVLSI